MPALLHRDWIFLGTVLLLVAGCGPDVTESPPVPARTEHAMALLPADAQFAGMLDLQDVQEKGGISFSSERGLTVRFLDSDLTFNPLSDEQQERLQEFIDATGFEPGTDLHAAYVVGDSTRPRAILLAAAMNRDQLVQQMLNTFSTRLDTTTYRGAPILQLRTEAGESTLQFALLDDAWIALSSDRATLQATINRALDSPSAPSDDHAMMPLVRAMGGRGGAWLALRDLPSQRLAQSANDQRMNQLARAVRDAASALRFEADGVAGTVLLTTDQEAADLADVVRGVVSAVKMNQEITAEQRQLLDQITVTAADGQVWITFNVPQETLARILIQSMRGGSRFVVSR